MRSSLIEKEAEVNKQKEALTAYVRVNKPRCEPKVAKVIELAASIGNALQDLYIETRTDLIEAEAEVRKLRLVIQQLVGE